LLDSLLQETDTMKLLLLLPLLTLTLGERAQVKYLGGITFLLRDRSPCMAVVMFLPSSSYLCPN